MSHAKFIFQAFTDGTATLTFTPPDISPKRGLAKLKKHAPVSMHLHAPEGSDDPIVTATLTFRDEYGNGWPFVGQNQAAFVWEEGQHAVTTVDANGGWKFGAVLKSQSGVTYTVPDPELHVGDGPSGGGKP